MEGLAGLHDVYRVRSLPVAVPCVEHRQAACPRSCFMSLRDHGYAKAPYLLAGGRKDMGGDEVGLVDADGNADEARARQDFPKLPRRGRASLVGESVEGELGGIIDPGDAVVVHHVWRVRRAVPGRHRARRPHHRQRRYQVLIESEFPSELAGLFKNLENKGNPWGQNSKDRLNWINEMDFEIPVYGQDADSFEDYEYLFWSAAPAPTRTVRRRPPRPSPSCSRPPA